MGQITGGTHSKAPRGGAAPDAVHSHAHTPARDATPGHGTGRRKDNLQIMSKMEQEKNFYRLTS